MPIKKFRHIGEAASPVAPPLLGDNVRAAFDLSETASGLRPWTAPRGVRRYASIDDAHEDRRSWELSQER